MPRFRPRIRPSLPRFGRGAWVQPGNVITRAIEHEMATGLPPHLPSEPDPVPGLVVPENREEREQGQPSSAA